MTNIYDQHKAAFANVSAYVVLDAQHNKVATIAFKYPRDGAGRLYCYLHIVGTPMVRGFATGYGYDKCSAAAEVAARKLSSADLQDWPETAATVDAFKNAIRDAGRSWDGDLREAGFTVLQAV